jgi:hypothetical protein
MKYLSIDGDFGVIFSSVVMFDESSQLSCESMGASGP